MRTLVITLLVVGGWAGCGDDSTPGEMDLSAALVDLSPPPDLAPTVPPDLLPPRVMRVNLVANASASLQVVAYAASCGRAFVGPCELVVCPTGTDDGYLMNDTRDQAGVITASDGAATITITPTTSGTYSATAGGPLTPTPSTAITVSAAGGNVPAFSTTVTVPAALTITSAPMNPLPRGMDATVTWTPMAGAEALVNLSQSDRAIVCHADSAAGTMVVPTAALQQLATGQASFGLFDVVRQDLVAGDYAVEVRGVRSMGGAANASLTVE